MTLFGVAALLGADRRPDARRLAHASTTTGAGSSHQRPDRRSRPPRRPTSWSRTRTTSSSERAELRRQPLNFDYIGLGLLALVMSCWEIMLSKGQEWDWLGDPFWRVQTLVILFVRRAGLPDLPGDADRQPDHQLPGARRAELRRLLRHHVLRLRRAVRRQHRRCRGCSSRCSATTPIVSGLVMSPVGLFSSMAAMVLVGVLLGRGVDARWLIAAGLVVMAAGELLDGADEPADQPGAGDLAAGGADRSGCGLMFAPISVAAFKYIPAHLRGAAVGLFSLLRNEGGSVGTSLAHDHPGAARAVPHWRAWASSSTR